MGASISSNIGSNKPVYSYNIYKKFGDAYVSWWPMSGFGQYCTDEKTALEQLEIEAKQGPCRLMKHQAVVQARTVIGLVDGTGEVIKEC